MAFVIGVEKGTGRYTRMGARPSSSSLKFISSSTSAVIPLSMFIENGILPNAPMSDTPYTDYPEFEVLDVNGNNITNSTHRSWTSSGYSISGISTGEYYLKVSAIAGPTGNPGYTPIKGVDFWTAEDISMIEKDTHEYIDSLILKAKW